MLGLVFKIFGDSRPFQHEMDKLQLGAQKAGKKIANKFNLGYAGLISGAVIGSVQAIQQLIAKGTENIQGASKLKTTVEEFEQLKALSDQTGESVEKLSETLKNGGVHAEQLRRAMQAVGQASGAGWMTREESGFFASMGQSFGNLWSGIKLGLGQAVKTVVDFNSLVTDAMFGTDFSSDGERTAGDMEAAQGEAALAVKRAEREARRKKLFEEGQAQAQDDVRKTAKDYYDKRQKRILDLMPDRGTADALTRVGIGNFGTAAESRNYQRDSLELFKKIEKNTSDSRTMKGFEDLLKTY